ncbi:MAG: TonB-dependent receptor [Phaeodactylibacter sp.]|nr:TonB-dependent receptor [Phaeodactylibacter sp.]
MKNLLSLLLAAMPAVGGLWCQAAQVSGRVAGEAGQPLEFASLTLHQASDSALAKGAVADSAGFFCFLSPPPGDYFIRASHVGYEAGETPVFSFRDEGRGHDVGTLRLSPQAETLDAVSVRGRKPFVERHLDKLVVNVENSIVSAGASVLEVLERSPNVFVDQNGNITLNGRPGVIIMMDDKPVQLSGDALANMLRGMSSNSIEKIEIISNPSARYDAQGSSGIINLRTKKGRQMGANGNVSLSAGHGKFGKATAGGNLNYRARHFNLFGNYQYSWNKFFNNLVVLRRFSDGGEVQATYDQNSFLAMPYNTHTARAGADFFPGPKTTVGFLASGTFSHFNPRGDNESSILGPQGEPGGRFTTTNRSRDRWNNYALNLNLRQNFAREGQSLTADLDYARYWNETAQLFHSYFFDTGGTLTGTDYLRGDIGGFLDLYSFKADYAMPLGALGKAEAGLKSSYVKADNDLKYFILLQGGEVLDGRQSNHFIYEENINAGYLNWNGEWGRWNVQAGLRGEQTVADGFQVTADSAFRRNYFQLFPSAFVNCKISDNHLLGISLSRRIDRPNYQQLNPFRAFVDPTTYRAGNPFLLPQLTYSAEFSHTFRQRISTTLSYSTTKDNITYALIQNDEARQTVVTNVNIRKYEYFGLGFNAPFELAKWWNANVNFLLYHNRFEGSVAGFGLGQGGTAFHLDLNQSFLLSGGFSAELGGFYMHRHVYGISVMEPMWALNAGIQKSLWEGKGTLRLNVSDIFWRSWPRGGTRFGNIDEVFRSYRETRVGRLAFSYNFGRKGLAPGRRRPTGAEEEKRRAGERG